MLGIFRRRNNEFVDQTAPPYAGRLSLIVLTIALSNLSLWCFGIRQQEIFDAVEQGAAVVEENMIGEIDEEQVRDAIRMQRKTFGFWSTLLMLGDLVFAPLSPVLRAIIVTVAFSAAAALCGRPVGHGVALAENITWQTFWAAGAGLEALMRIAVSANASISWVVFMPANEYPASTVHQLAILNPLALCGWVAMGWFAWKRRQANGVVAGFLIVFLASMETSVHGTLLTMLGSLMRLSFTST